MRYNRSYTPNMKTAISIPDHIFAEAEKQAKRLGISRSEFYSIAIEKYIASMSQEEITAALNQVYGDKQLDNSVDPLLNTMQMGTLTEEDWE